MARMGRLGAGGGRRGGVRGATGGDGEGSRRGGGKGFFFKGTGTSGICTRSLHGAVRISEGGNLECLELCSKHSRLLLLDDILRISSSNNGSLDPP